MRKTSTDMSVTMGYASTRYSCWAGSWEEGRAEARTERVHMFKL